MSLPSKSSGVSIPLQDRIFVALLQLADALSQEAEQFLKAAGLTGTQIVPPERQP